MRRGIWMGVLLVMLSGCGAKQSVVYETVTDVFPVCAVEEAPYDIALTLPSDARELAKNAEGCLYEAADGAYTICTRTLVTDGLDAAVYTLSGFAQPQIRLNGEEGDREACQFAWSCAGEQGQMVCRTKVLREGDYCYALCFSLKEGLGREYNECINEVFSSFTLIPHSETVSGNAEVLP